MKRRNYISYASVFGLSALLGRNYLQNESLAVDYNLNLDENMTFNYEDNIEMKFEFSILNIYPESIDIEKPLYIRFFEVENDNTNLISEKEYENIGDEIPDITNEVNDNPLLLSNITKDIESLNGDERKIFNYNIQLEVEWDDVVIQSQVETLDIEIRRKIIDKIYDDEEEQDFETTVLTDESHIDDSTVITRVEPDIKAAFDGDLDESNFIVSEEDEEEKFRKQSINITDLNTEDTGETNIIYAIDDSGSVSDFVGDIKDAIKEFVNNLDESYNYALISYTSDSGADSKIYEKDIGEYENDEEFKDTVDDMPIQDLSPSNSDGVFEPLAEDQFENNTSEDSNDFVIMLGDGDHFDENYDPEGEFTIMSIYFDGSSGTSEMEEIASKDSDGNNLFFDTSDDDDFDRAFESIREEIAGEYELEYESELTEDEERDILIQVFDDENSSEVVYNTDDE